jgi:hypothetical protein
MMGKLHIFTSPITNRIYCGDVNKAGGSVVVTCNGEPVYRVSFEKLSNADD